jgi:hypothetical protein
MNRWSDPGRSEKTQFAVSRDIIVTPAPSFKYPIPPIMKEKLERRRGGGKEGRKRR